MRLLTDTLILLIIVIKYFISTKDFLLMQRHTLEEFPFKVYDLDNLKLLGSGSYGKVFKSTNLKTGQDVAIKQMNMQKINQQQLNEALQRQIDLMKEVKSQNVVELLDSQVGKKFTYIILQLCDTDLRKKLNSLPQSKLTEQECIEMFGGIMNGFKSLVENSCIHRDIKPENVLIKNKVSKLADFGFARKADILCAEKYDEMCGTPIYMAPQILSGELYTSKCDVWSLGLMLFEMLYGCPPWPCRSLEAYSEAIRKRPLAFPFDVKVGNETKDFIKKALVVDEQKRLSWQQVYQHPFIKNKVTGQLSLIKPLEPRIRMILAKMQNEAQLKQVDQIDIFKKYSFFESLNKQQFTSLLKQLNPTVTSYQINVIFQTCDKNNNGSVDRSQFQEMFCTINYRLEPEVSREIDEIVGMIKAKQININELFQKFDKNKTGALDTTQFKEMILSFAPKYDWVQLKKLYNFFDKNKSGLIDKKEFLDTIGTGFANQSHFVGIWMERAKRNFKMLKVHLNSIKLSADDLLKMADLNADKNIEIAQFEKLMGKINFVISKEEIGEVFKLIDSNNSSQISAGELIQYMK